MPREGIWIALLIAAVHPPLDAQQVVGPARQNAGSGPALRASAAAVFAPQAPVIDGRDDDAIWRLAQPITDFLQDFPVEGAEPTFRTVGYIAYDARTLYVFLRAYDAHPDSIGRLLARRDVFTPADRLGLLVDPYHDRRTGYEFNVNPAGVKTDYAIQNDADEDGSWDGVWDVATRVDSLGWTAEFRIPLSQLRYRAAASDTFGIELFRRVQRLGEGSTWPLRRVTVPGLVSQFGELTGLSNLAPPSRAEIVPYVVAKYRSNPAGGGATGEQATLGGDLKVAVAADVTLNATVNPDFGQVEADPAELNLTAFETFFRERRPFFVQGASVFNVPLNCGLWSCYQETLFYSRRIGRSPELRDLYGDARSPTATRILGAAKLTGHLGGIAFGGLGAGTERVAGPGGVTIEPGARYEVLRVSRDLRHGESGIGVMVTGLQRDLDSLTAPALHHGAYAGGVDFRHRFQGQYVIHGSAHWSRVTGSASAIAATEREPVHNYQRPDGALALDTTVTSLTGDDEQLAFDKLGGLVQWQAIYMRRSPGFDVNDLGYLRLADQQSGYAWLGLMFTRPTRRYLSVTWNFNSWLTASTAGLVTDRAFNSNIHVMLRNMWMVGAWVSFGQLGATFCDRCARGGPALRQDPYTQTWFNVMGDDRHPLIPSLTLQTYRGDGGRSRWVTVSPSLSFNASTRLATSLGIAFTTNHDNTQWFGNAADSTGRTHYTFAHLDQRTLGVTATANYTLSTTLSVQAYLQPFVSWGTYRDVRELAAPRAAAYDQRFAPFATGNPGGLNDKQLNANVVVRWEYRPGSTLFLVWSQGRQGFTPFAGSRGAAGNLGDVFVLPADNTLLLKVSYWLSR